MSRYEHEVKRVPIGMNDNQDVSLMPQARCSVMLGVASKSGGGVLEEALRQTLLRDNGSTTVHCEAIFPYRGNALANDKVLTMLGGALKWATITANQPPTSPPDPNDALKFTLSALTNITNSSDTTFTAGKRVRAVQRNDEVFFVQEGGIQPCRYNGTAIYNLGFARPAAPTSGAQSGGGALTALANYEWCITYADEKGRESSPSPTLSVTMTGANTKIVINWTAPAAGDANQYQRSYLYRRAATGTVWYRVVEAGFAPGTFTYTDGISDVALQNNSSAPLVGQNDRPLAASLIGLYKNRLVLDCTDYTNGTRGTIQISNLSAPSQFSQLNDTDYPSDGETFQALDDRGDQITGFGQMGSGLAIFTRMGCGILVGENVTEFRYLPLDRTGCTAPDTITECRNRLLFMGEDGVYSVSYAGGFVVTKVSGDLNKQFTSVTISVPEGSLIPTIYSRADRARAANAWYAQNRYYLASPPYVYILDFETGGWAMRLMTEYTTGYQSGGGYLSVGVIEVDRQFDVALVSPDWSAVGASLGNIWANTYYPVVHNSQVEANWSFTYRTRAIDGNGVHRERLKRLKRSTIFGTVFAAPGANSLAEGSWNANISITAIVDEGAYTETYTYTNISLGALLARYQKDQQQGKLLIQEWSPKVMGRILQVQVDGFILGRLNHKDELHEYIAIDG